MNTIAVVLAVVVFGVVNAEESNSVEENRDENNATIKTSGLNGQLLLDLQSLIAKLSTQGKEADDNGKNEDTNEDSRNANTDIGKDPEKDLEKAITNKSEISNGTNEVLTTKGIKIIERLRRILEGKYAVNPGSDAEDSENEMQFDHDDNVGHVNIDDDDSQSDKFNRDGSSHNRHGYGASLNTKGRLGLVPIDQLLQRPLVTRRIIYHNPGYYQLVTPSPIISNNINHDLKPMNLFNNGLLRQANIQKGPEETTQNDSEDILDDINSYKYEPEIKGIETRMIPWGSWG